jgi:hypothetical protein
LPAKSVAVRIINKLECFSEADSSPEEQEEEPDPMEPVLRRDPENKLQVEGAQLGEEKHEDDPTDGQPPLEGGQRVPGELDPSMRTEKKQNYEVS